jgi:hypothetical protein
MAALAVGDKASPDALFGALLPLIAQNADDDRPLVRKGASWALRQIGKRSPALNELAIATASALEESGSRDARWVGVDALRELSSDAVQARLAAIRDRESRGGAARAAVDGGSDYRERALALIARYADLPGS